MVMAAAWDVQLLGMYGMANTSEIRSLLSDVIRQANIPQVDELSQQPSGYSKLCSNIISQTLRCMVNRN